MSADAELKSYRFRAERETEWKALEGLLDKVQSRGPHALDREEMLRLPELYRAAVSSLSTARAVALDRNLIAYLEGLCTRGYLFMYGPRTTLLRRLGEFFAFDWPDAVRRAKWATLLSALCMFGAALVAYFMVMNDPEWFYSFRAGFVDSRTPEATAEQLRDTLYTEDYDIGESLATFAGFLFANNTLVSLLAFALGFAVGIPTALLLMYNGLVVGAFFALYTSKGLSYELGGWLLIHGVTELFAIVLAGAAGFLIGGRIVFPGNMRRIDAIAEAGKQAGTIGMGVVIMLLIAALLEGFGRQLINSDEIRYTIAISSLIFWCVYFYTPRGRNSR